MSADFDTSHEEYLYDAILTQIDSARGLLIFSVGNATHRVSSPHISCFSPGAAGRLRLPTEREPFAFHIYADQRLRRAPELDDARDQRWGWCIGERRFAVRSGLLPGRNGSVVQADTEAVTLDLPREFLDFCETRGLKPARVLGAYVADVCGLSSLFECPREDRYTSGGSDEREFAMAYFQRAFGWVDEPEYRAKVKAARRARKSSSERKKESGVHRSGEAEVRK
jgi:hypothetical protein